ncbi:glycosyltransferase [Clostridium algidicarnis]|uniref:GT2 family glycosyltransferase n=1 Tax=Clostridium algidicarnis DSM 15099 TaxID=1121295 RepID=A0A2S6FV36_9CLOT|nr:glycosyltransferase family 2 protein [Clostridium algidicarnis]PPK45280.1 GT2 family glycosyltransferase [Clostridium algidicarnis DSM 15099]
MKQSKIGIVILNYMTYELTINCLNNLNSIVAEDFFVVIVDNLSPNNSYEKMDNYISENRFKYDIFLLKTDKNGGYSYGNNVGIKKAEELKADYILIMNNDIVIEDYNVINKLADYLNENRSVAMVGPGIIQKKSMIELPLISKRVTPFVDIVKNVLYPCNIILYKILRKRIQKHKEPIKVYSLSGCCFMIRTTSLKQVNYFDDKLFLYGEELILGEKLYKNNFGVYFIPTLNVVHNHSITIKSIYDSKKISAMKQESYKYYLDQYRKDIDNKVSFLMVYSYFFVEKLYDPLIVSVKKILR